VSLNADKERNKGKWLWSLLVDQGNSGRGLD